MNKDELYLLRCIELASKALGNVAPNPMVGSVIVFNDRVLAEGYHHEYGKEHAEANAIQEVISRYPNYSELLAQATLYVNLEPCAHYGKTPPCSDLIINHRIPRVVIGSIDPFASVNGKGIERLKAAGVKVDISILKAKSDELNKRFFTYHQKQRPYIILKWAESSDAFMASKYENRTQISGAYAQRLLHKWRSEEQAIMVGTRTAAIDNPKLNVRLWQGKNPLRVVIDKNLQLPKNLHLFDNRIPTLIFNTQKNDSEGLCTYVQIDSDNLLIPQILYQLYLMDIQSLLVEGGANTFKEFLQLGLWDEARVFKSKEIKLTEGITTPEMNKVYLTHTEAVGSDILNIYRKKK